MCFTRYKQAFDRDGFVVIPQFLSEEDLAELNSNLDRYVREIVPTLSDVHAFYQDKNRPETLKQMQNMSKQDAYFEDYRGHARWNSLAEILLGEPVEPQQAEWFNKPPLTEHPTPPHQDNYYFKLRPPNVMTAWLALDPIDEENGCLRYVAGSHRLGLRPHCQTEVLGFSQGITDYGVADESREQVICLQPGDLAVHHGETIHRADPNRSAIRHRRAFAMVFYGASCELDEEAHRRHQEIARSQHKSMGLKLGED